MNEDQIAQTIINQNKPVESRSIELEKRYNHYGDRGVVDLVILDRDIEAMWVTEIKANHAMEQATGANEIIRQFNKHREFFRKGVDKRYPVKPYRTNYDLVFAATDVCYQHLMDNYTLYENLLTEGNIHIVFKHPELANRGKPFQDDPVWDGWENQYVYSDHIDGLEQPQLKEEHQPEEAT